MKTMQDHVDQVEAMFSSTMALWYLSMTERENGRKRFRQELSEARDEFKKAKVVQKWMDWLVKQFRLAIS